ncbi:MAG: hypothetical protein ACE5KW_00415 [Dehalococcoidia bacterium]
MLRLSATAIAATAALALLALLAGCSGGGRAAESTPTPEPELVASCDAIEDIHSFRYSLRFQLDGPGLSLDGDAGQGASLSQFAESLIGLLSDMQIEGAFVAPDRSQTVLRFQGEKLEVRTIGDKRWVRLDNVWQKQTAPSDDTMLSPQTVCSEILPGLTQHLARASATPETLNGVATCHYSIDGADLVYIERLFGEGADSELPEHFSGDVWLAEQGGWPVKLQVIARGNADNGKPVGLKLSMEFRSINSPDIEITPPPKKP